MPTQIQVLNHNLNQVKNYSLGLSFEHYYYDYNDWIATQPTIGLIEADEIFNRLAGLYDAVVKINFSLIWTQYLAVEQDQIPRDIDGVGANLTKNLVFSKPNQGYYHTQHLSILDVCVYLQNQISAAEQDTLSIELQQKLIGYKKILADLIPELQNLKRIAADGILDHENKNKSFWQKTSPLHTDIDTEINSRINPQTTDFDITATNTSGQQAYQAIKQQVSFQAYVEQPTSVRILEAGATPDLAEQSQNSTVVNLPDAPYTQINPVTQKLTFIPTLEIDPTVTLADINKTLKRNIVNLYKHNHNGFITACATGVLPEADIHLKQDYKNDIKKLNKLTKTVFGHCLVEDSNQTTTSPQPENLIQQFEKIYQNKLKTLAQIQHPDVFEREKLELYKKQGFIFTSRITLLALTLVKFRAKPDNKYQLKRDIETLVKDGLFGGKEPVQPTVKKDNTFSRKVFDEVVEYLYTARLNQNMFEMAFLQAAKDFETLTVKGDDNSVILKAAQDFHAHAATHYAANLFTIEQIKNGARHEDSQDHITEQASYEENEQAAQSYTLAQLEVAIAENPKNISALIIQAIGKAIQPKPNQVAGYQEWVITEQDTTNHKLLGTNKKLIIRKLDFDSYDFIKKEDYLQALEQQTTIGKYVLRQEGEELNEQTLKKYDARIDRHWRTAKTKLEKAFNEAGLLRTEILRALVKKQQGDILTAQEANLILPLFNAAIKKGYSLDKAIHLEFDAYLKLAIKLYQEQLAQLVYEIDRDIAEATGKRNSGFIKAVHSSFTGAPKPKNTTEIIEAHEKAAPIVASQEGRANVIYVTSNHNLNYVESIYTVGEVTPSSLLRGGSFPPNAKIPQLPNQVFRTHTIHDQETGKVERKVFQTHVAPTPSEHSSSLKGKKTNKQRHKDTSRRQIALEYWKQILGAFVTQQFDQPQAQIIPQSLIEVKPTEMTAETLLNEFKQAWHQVTQEFEKLQDSASHSDNSDNEQEDDEVSLLPYKGKKPANKNPTDEADFKLHTEIAKQASIDEQSSMLAVAQCQNEEEQLQLALSLSRQQQQREYERQTGVGYSGIKPSVPDEEFIPSSNHMAFSTLAVDNNATPVLDLYIDNIQLLTPAYHTVDRIIEIFRGAKNNENRQTRDIYLMTRLLDKRVTEVTVNDGQGKKQLKVRPHFQILHLPVNTKNKVQQAFVSPIINSPNNRAIFDLIRTVGATLIYGLASVDLQVLKNIQLLQQLLIEHNPAEFDRLTANDNLKHSAELLRADLNLTRAEHRLLLATDFNYFFNELINNIRHNSELASVRKQILQEIAKGMAGLLAENATDIDALNDNILIERLKNQAVKFIDNDKPKVKLQNVVAKAFGKFEKEEVYHLQFEGFFAMYIDTHSRYAQLKIMLENYDKREQLGEITKFNHSKHEEAIKAITTLRKETENLEKQKDKFYQEYINCFHELLNCSKVKPFIELLDKQIEGCLVHNHKVLARPENQTLLTQLLTMHVYLRVINLYNSGNYAKRDHSYEIQALYAILSKLLDRHVNWNCKSNQDRSTTIKYVLDTFLEFIFEEGKLPSTPDDYAEFTTRLNQHFVQRPLGRQITKDNEWESPGLKKSTLPTALISPLYILGRDADKLSANTHKKVWKMAKKLASQERPETRSQTDIAFIVNRPDKNVDVYPVTHHQIKRKPNTVKKHVVSAAAGTGSGTLSLAIGMGIVTYLYFSERNLSYAGSLRYWIVGTPVALIAALAVGLTVGLIVNRFWPKPKNRTEAFEFDGENMPLLQQQMVQPEVDLENQEQQQAPDSNLGNFLSAATVQPEQLVAEKQAFIEKEERSVDSDDDFNIDETAKEPEDAGMWISVFGGRNPVDPTEHGRTIQQIQQSTNTLTGYINTQARARFFQQSYGTAAQSTTTQEQPSNTSREHPSRTSNTPS
ncbi:MAG: hypothetical protein K0S11_1283 [Gammaproteobacteria bacterium]|nr:hypothetical protein [Gammaproteobacteria bacterium]